MLTTFCSVLKISSNTPSDLRYQKSLTRNGNSNNSMNIGCKIYFVSLVSTFVLSGSLSSQQ